ncbi:uncharacterized protein N0V89_010875 [Didymosphaeria variabile]|uniref:Uncharacterized protein n=1 Tax=Didymosphaeria variabile TaxID=1932322 RepID=A0A9W9C7J8_9PLEO|nr:uncharacterized protein N0V89_010875 [Didymosphaeria variabile]KAJ4346942.1 hypothetical protein N0V89_010875 [Didymosphaeria variabile]
MEAFSTTRPPIVYLFSKDPYRPSPPIATLANTRPKIAREDISFPTSPLTLTNLDQLNNVAPKGKNDVYLTSIADVTTNPAWLNGIQTGDDGGTGNEKTCAIMVVDKALYPTPGTHDHTIPNLNITTSLLLVDDADAGPKYDPLLSAYFYTFAPSSKTFTPVEPTPDAPTGWLYYKGKWGDEEYPASDKRQKSLLGNKKYVGGPTGPADKQLDRKEVWPQNQWSGGQKIRTTLDAGWVAKQWFSKLNCFGGTKKGVIRVKVSGEVIG